MLKKNSLYAYHKSREIFEEAKELFPGGVREARLPLTEETSPSFLVRGRGSRCWDVDGNEFIDFIGALGPNILGYCHPALVDAITKQVQSGILLSMNTPLQNELIRKLIDTFPCAEMGRILKTGSEATTSAIWTARAYTGKNKIIRCGYHGWNDWCAAGRGTTHPDERPPRGFVPNVPGVPKVIQELTYDLGDPNDLNYLEELLRNNKGEVACLIIAPEEIRPPIKQTLSSIRALTQEYGVLLIIDEVKTGFRVALGGAQEYFEVMPDLCTVSKAMGNGMPIAALLGKREIMDKSEGGGTFMCETLSLTASLTTIKVMEESNGVEHLWKMGRRLLDGINALIAMEGMEEDVEGQAWPVPSMPIVWFKKNRDKEERRAMRIAFYKEVMGRGILMSWNHMNFINLSHSESDIDTAIEICGKGLKVVKKTYQTH